MWIVVDIGCLDCGNPTTILAVSEHQEIAETVANNAIQGEEEWYYASDLPEEPCPSGWAGDYIIVIFEAELEEHGKLELHPDK